MPMFADSLRNVAAATLVAALTIAALVLGRSILVPFALAMVLTFILQPLVRRLTRLGVPHGASAGLVVLTTVAFVIAASAVFSGQLLTLTGDLANYRQNVAAKVRTIVGPSASDGVFRKATTAIETIGKDLRREIDGPTPATGPPVREQVVVAKSGEATSLINVAQLEGVLAPMTFAGLVLLFTLFLLLQHQDLRDRVIRVAGTDNMSLTSAALSEAGSRLSDLFTMQALLNVSFGAFVAAALAVIGVPNPILWGVATALLRFVPFIGSFIAAVPPLILAAAVDPGWTLAIATLALFMIGEPIMGHLIEPLVLGRRAGLSPLAFILAASFWTLVWGPIGLLLAAPLTMTLVVLGQFVPRFEFMTVLLGDAPALAPEQEFYHRLLSSDPYAAYEQINDEIAETSLATVADKIVIPALQLAARDHRTGMITDEQVAELRTDAREFIDILAGEQRSSAADKDAGDPVLVVAARGPIDELAARFVASVLEMRIERPIVLLESAGLMGLAGAPGILDARVPTDLLVVTVGGLDKSFSRLIQKRAARDYPQTRIVSCQFYPDGDDMAIDAASTSDMQYRCASIAQLIPLLGATDRKAATDEAAAIGQLASDRSSRTSLQSPKARLA